MPKRKSSPVQRDSQSTPSKRRRKDVADTDDQQMSLQDTEEVLSSPSKKPRANGQAHSTTPSKLSTYIDFDDLEDTDLTPRPNGKTLFTTPRRTNGQIQDTPSRIAKADQSAKRKSGQALVTTQEEDDWENAAALARQVLAATGEDIDEPGDVVLDSTENGAEAPAQELVPVTPSKRGRPKGAKNKRSPTPEGDLPPEERYFFQNRAGPPKVSGNSFSLLGLLTHDEYIQHMQQHKHHHPLEKSHLVKLHSRSFLQWKFEMEQGFNVCLYGYGSKRSLITKYAEWLHPRLPPDSRIVMINGRAPRLNIRSVLTTIGNALMPEGQEMKLIGQPHDLVDTILSHISSSSSPSPILTLLINSLDSPHLRSRPVQSILSRLASSSPRTTLLATTDTPTFQSLWPSTLRDQYRFLYHDTTTFSPYDPIETAPVDDIHDLLGRKNRRVGGREGVGFVLRSLPENARNLYRVLLTEILSKEDDDDNGLENENDNDGYDDDEFNQPDDSLTPGRRRRGRPKQNELPTELASSSTTTIEYRALYQKALEEFICSSDMNFRFLLKEFHDHQMIFSRRETGGSGAGVAGEVLGVPLSRTDMEAVLEDLVIG